MATQSIIMQTLRNSKISLISIVLVSMIIGVGIVITNPILIWGGVSYLVFLGLFLFSPGKAFLLVIFIRVISDGYGLSSLPIVGDLMIGGSGSLINAGLLGAVIIWSLFLIINQQGVLDYPLVIPFLLFMLFSFFSALFSHSQSLFDSILIWARLLSTFLIYVSTVILLRKGQLSPISLINAVLVMGIIPIIVGFYNLLTGNISIIRGVVAYGSTFSSKNQYAIFLIFLIIIILSVMWDKKRNNIIYLLYLLVAITALLLIRSRVGLLTAFVVLLFLASIFHKRLLIVIPVIALVAYRFIPGMSLRFSQTLMEGSTLYERFDFWRLSYDLFLNNRRYLFGNGLGYFETIRGIPPHSAYVQLLVELGVLGLIAFLTLIISMLYRSYLLVINRDQEYKMWGILSIGLIFTLLITSLTENTLYSSAVLWPFWMLMGGAMHFAYSTNHKVFGRAVENSNLRIKAKTETENI